MTKDQANVIAHAVVHRLLDHGLAKSTWKELYPEAWAELRLYADDMVKDVEGVLKRLEIK